jgi:TonB family protein
VTRKIAAYFGPFFPLAVAGAILAISAVAQEPLGDFQASVRRAATLSTLTEPGAQPFHLKLTAQDTTMRNPEYNSEIELWWAAPDQWRRAVKSPAFTQIAIQNGGRYYESNSATDYLPYWLDELMRGAVDPIPVAALADVSADEDRPGCGNWEVVHGAGAEEFVSYASMCFNPDGTAREIVAEPMALKLDAYQRFGDKRIARQLNVWPGGRSEVTARVTALEPLENEEHSESNKANSGLFDVPHDIGLASRVRFVSVQESLLAPADSPARPALTWPASYTFPLDGVIAVTIQIDRTGNIRELPSAISKNQRIDSGALAQIRNWKFKPYLVDDVPVEVVTTLHVRFHLKYQPLGANGKEFPAISFGEHIRQYRVLSDLRLEGSKPFHLRASFVLNGDQAGKYDETWRSAGEWTRQVELGSIVFCETRSGGNTTTSFNGGAGVRPKMQAIMAATGDLLPEQRTFQEADWGNSAVPESNVYPSSGSDSSEPVLIRAARGAVDANNHPTSGQAYWFDADGLLRASFVGGTSVVNSKFASWDTKQVPRRIELFIATTPIAVVTVDSIEAP